jgi:hypothetical protein
MADDEVFPTPPASLKRRVTASLRERGVLPRRPFWTQAPVAIAAGLALFLGGTQVPRLMSTAPSTGPAFALLLYEDESFQPTVPLEEIVVEYTEWADRIRQRGELVLAEELDPVMQMAGTEVSPDVGPLGQLTGMFVVRAVDREAAMELARNHPHIKHGGRIVVRGFVQRS